MSRVTTQTLILVDAVIADAIESLENGEPVNGLSYAREIIAYALAKEGGWAVEPPKNE